MLHALSLLLLTSTAPIPAKPSESRQRISLDADWKFLRGEPNGASIMAPGTPVVRWRWTADDKGEADAAEMADPKLDDKTSLWHDAVSGEDTFKGRVGFSWYRATLPPFNGPRPVLHFDSVDDKATVYLNGVRLVHHIGWDDPFDVPLSSAWHTTGPNKLAVLVENTAAPGGINDRVYIQTSDDVIAAKGPALFKFQDEQWRTVHVPHDYIVEGKFVTHGDTSHGSLPKVTAWYRRKFDLSASAKGKAVWIDFEGIYRDSRMWLNGHYLGRHRSGYTSFRYNISRYANFGGSNVLSIHVDPIRNEGWWYEGGGIYRHVWLNIANPVHVAPWGVAVATRLPEPSPGQAVPSAEVAVRTRVENSGGGHVQAQLDSQVRDDTGRVVASASVLLALGPGEKTELPCNVTVSHPRLWSLQHPHLYRITNTVLVNGVKVDAVSNTFGIRTIRFDANKGFFLNGVHVKIQGTCNHQDFAGIGIAVPDGMEYWRVNKLKNMGANAWRMSHNPPTPSLLDACDRLGMLVLDENRHLGDSPDTLSEVSSMVQRDRNHPSIIMWSLCNEQSEAGTVAGGKIFEGMKAVVLRYDATRPITSAMNSGWFSNGFTDVEDLMGVNYNYEVYDRFHEMHPKIPMFGSETASTLTTRGVYADDRVRAYVSSYNMTDDSWKPAAQRPYIAGTFVWTGFDYKGEPTPYGWPCVNSHFGILDMCGFPKDNYYYYRSWWTSKPTLHILPHWNWPKRIGQPITVVVFSNADRVDLFLNGTRLGAKDMPRDGHLEWTVPYRPGTLSARGYDSHGKLVSKEAVSTTGSPFRLRLRTDRPTFVANGEDSTVVEVEVLDAQGRVVPTADNLVRFEVTGAAGVSGVGNGNPSDHDPDTANYRHAFNGLCAVIVRAGDKAGKVHVSAKADGLKVGELELLTTPH